ncbi:MAG TPA: DUF302 domain-containing protein [Candidatus Elarobacter sp.]|jgi:uncharacterized protein (DUF302 family)
MEGTAETAIGLLTATSRYPVAETIDRLAAAVKMAGNTIFARIDHAANAAEAGLTLPPTQVLIFGNANAGTPLMRAAPPVGIDLPLRYLVWQAADGTTRVAWTDPLYFAARYNLRGHEAQLVTMRRALAGFVAPLA